MAVPSVLVPLVNVTVPVGIAVPLAGFTVAESCVEAVCAMEAGLAVSDVVVLTLETTPVQFVINFPRSADPSPVTWSYPLPAL